MLRNIKLLNTILRFYCRKNQCFQQKFQHAYKPIISKCLSQIYHIPTVWEYARSEINIFIKFNVLKAKQKLSDLLVSFSANLFLVSQQTRCSTKINQSKILLSSAQEHKTGIVDLA